MRAYLAMVLLVMAAAPAAAGEVSGAAALFPTDPGNARAFACYTRHYDKSHLASHPQQNVTDMTVLVDSDLDLDHVRTYVLGMGVNFRDLDKQFQASGGCSAGSDGTHALNCGIDCDGGTIDVKVRDANSILVEIPYGARTWDPGDVDESADLPDAAHFGEDDKLFRLDRTALSQCVDLAWEDDVKAQLAASR